MHRTTLTREHGAAVIDGRPVLRVDAYILLTYHAIEVARWLQKG